MPEEPTTSPIANSPTEAMSPAKEVSQPKSSSKGLLIFLIIGFLIIAGFLGYIYWKPVLNFLKGAPTGPTLENPVKTSTPSATVPTESKEKDETESWLLFTNTSNKYSIKHPKDIGVYSNTQIDLDKPEDSADVIFTNDPKITAETRGIEGSVAIGSYFLQIYIISQSGNSYYTGKTLEQIAQGDYNKNKTSAETITELTATKFGGKDAYSFQKTKATAFDYLAGGWVLNKETIKVIEVLNGDSVFYIIFRPDETIEKMLTTFKFL